MNKLDKQYQDLLQSILDYGVEKQDRTGTGTKSIFGYTIRHKMSDGFPLLTTKKMAWKTMVTELIWFLRGDTNIKYLVENGCHIWDGDAYKRYADSHTTFKDGFAMVTPIAHSRESFIEAIKADDEFAKKWGELGPIYGKQWRSWEKWYIDENKRYLTFTKKIDQIQNLINDLKTNPDSRRLMVNAWNVGELDQMVLPPCHYGFQVYTRELSNKERIILMNKKLGVTDTLPQYYNTDGEMDKNNIPTRAISLMWNQRSVDTFLGLPFNIASYGLLLEIIAKEVNMVPDELIGNLGDVHLYLNHIEQAKEQIGRDLTDEERYNKWFNNNYETGMERYFDPNNLPDFDNEYYVPTPKRTREPFELPKLGMDYREGEYDKNLTDFVPDDFYLIDYQSHPAIKAPLSN
jgi:thymidylate synthase